MKYRVIGCICLICILLLGLITKPNPVSATGTTYYVAKTGSDNNPGTLAQPWLTINHAALEAHAGDTVEVETGTYNEYVFDCYNSGTAVNPITFENYPGESPVIDGTGLATPASDYGLIYIAGNVSYVNWSGFTVQNSQTYEGIYIFSSSYINITNMVIHNTYASAIKMQGTGGYITINNCQIYDCNTGNVNETIDMMPMSNVTIENCYLHNNPYDGIDVKNGCNNISIHNNEITSMGNGEDGIYIDCEGTTQNNISIYGNKIHDFTGDGIVLGSEVGSGSLISTSIYNNLFYNIAGEAFQAQPYSFNKTVSVINNTFYDNTVAIDWDDTAAQYQVNCVTRNNIIVGNTTSALINYQYYAQGGVTVDHNLFYDTAGYNTVCGTNYVEANPLLTNPPANFSLQSGSPAIGAGSSVGAPSTDYIGTARPQSQGYDIGAYEYVTASIPPSVTTNVAINVTTNGATLSGSLTALGTVAPVNVLFEWGIDTNYAVGNIVATPSSISGVPTVFTAILSGLASGTTYHYRAEAVGGADTIYGIDQQFTTLNSPLTLSITTNSLPTGYVGENYSQTMAATGGTAPYTWAITSGTLPAGLSLSSAGVISGSPMIAYGPTSIIVQVTDSVNASATQSLSIPAIYASWDINLDESVNVLDLILVAQDFGQTGTPGWIREDVNDSGEINILDLIAISQHFTS